MQTMSGQRRWIVPGGQRYVSLYFSSKSRSVSILRIALVDILWLLDLESKIVPRNRSCAIAKVLREDIFQPFDLQIRCQQRNWSIVVLVGMTTYLLCMVFELIDALIPSNEEDLHFSIAIWGSEYTV
jgi:hypothetical protein